MLDVSRVLQAWHMSGCFPALECSNKISELFLLVLADVVTRSDGLKISRWFSCHGAFIRPELGVWRWWMDGLALALQRTSLRWKSVRHPPFLKSFTQGGMGLLQLLLFPPHPCSPSDLVFVLPLPIRPSPFFNSFPPMESRTITTPTPLLPSTNPMGRWDMTTTLVPDSGDSELSTPSMVTPSSSRDSSLSLSNRDFIKPRGRGLTVQ